MTALEKVDIITQVADDMKAEQIETLDVREKTPLTDYFVVCGASNDRLVQAIADRVEDKLRKHKVKPQKTDGEGTGWVLQDYGDVILHIMREEQRQFYDLETLWKTVQPNPDLKGS